MLHAADFKEFFYAVFLIAGVSVTGLIIGVDSKREETVAGAIVKEPPHAVPLIANPVVNITVPTHNIFEK